MAQDPNLTSVQQDNFLKQLIEALKRIRVLEKEVLILKKRVQVLESTP